MQYRFTLIFLMFITSSFGQTDARVPRPLMQYYNINPVFNPSYSGVATKTIAIAGTQSNVGPYRKVGTYYGHAFLTLKQKKESRKTCLGINLWNDNEGTILNRTRAFLQMSHHIRLNDRLNLSSGIALGLISFTIRGSQEAADTKPNMRIGATLYHQKYELGLSINQIITANIAPLSEVFPLTPYLYGHAKWKKEINSVFKNEISIQLRKTTFADLEYNILNMVSMYDILKAGVALLPQKGIAYHIGSSTTSPLRHQFELYFSYFVPFQKSALIRVPAFEITAAYKINN